MIARASRAVVSKLWWAYGFTYDGLLHFYPYTKLLGQIVSRVGPNPGNVLEIGCGTGNVLAAIIASASSESAAQVTGIDISPTMLAVARKKLKPAISKGNAELVHSDILSYLRKLPASSYDTVVSVNVLYALEHRDLIWRELFRVVKPSGKMVMTTSTKTGSWPIIAEHLKYGRTIDLFRPKLLGVFILDILINVLGNTGHFEFPDRETLASEVKSCGGKWQNEQRSYGGDEGVNIIFEVTKASS